MRLGVEPFLWGAATVIACYVVFSFGESLGSLI